MKSSILRPLLLTLALMIVAPWSSVQAINLSDLAGLNNSAKILSFSATRNYQLNEVVYHNGKFYRAKAAVSAAAFTASQWNPLSTFRGKYAANQDYAVDDVIWGTDNKIYRVTTAFNSAALAVTNATIQPKLQIIGGTGGGIEYDTTKSYSVNDIIVRGGEFLINKTATTGSVSVPHAFNTAEWKNWKKNDHTIVADDTALLALTPRINDTVYKTDNETLYRYTATDGTNDALADWTVVYDFKLKVNQTEFEARFGAKNYDSTKTYKANELIIEGGVLYRTKATVGTFDANGAVTAAAGTFDSSKFEVLVNITALTPIGSIDMSSDPSIPAPTTANTKYYYIVQTGSSGAVSYANLTTNTEYAPGDMIINLSGSAWSHIKNTTRWATKVEAEKNISLLKDDGTEKTDGTVTAVKVLSPLRALQQLLHNRLASLFQLRDDTDETKKVQFALSGITTGKTRTLTIPDEDITIAGQNRVGTRDWALAESYIKNQIVLKDGVHWRANAAIAINTAWDRTKWSFMSNANAWVTITSATNLASFGRYALDSSAAAFDITLPATPVKGDTIELRDFVDLSAKNVTIKRNAKTILGKSDDLLLDIKHASVKLTYTGSTWLVDFSTPDVNN